MNYEKVIKREDKSQIKIEVSVIFPDYRDKDAVYKTMVFRRDAGKRKWHQLIYRDTWRSYTDKEQEEYNQKYKVELEKYTSEEEIYQAKLEAWELLKPKK